MKHFSLLNKVLNFSAERHLKAAGNLFIYEGEYDQALESVNKALDLEQENTRALVLKADILFCLNRDMEALQVLNQTLKVSPDCAEAYISKAGVLDVLGKTRDALECCNRAFLLITKLNEYLLPSLYDQKMILLIRLNRFREAQQALKESAQRLPNEEYANLRAYYKSLIDRCAQKRGPSNEQAKKLSLRVILGQKNAPR